MIELPRVGRDQSHFDYRLRMTKASLTFAEKNKLLDDRLGKSEIAFIIDLPNRCNNIARHVPMFTLLNGRGMTTTLLI